MLQVLLRITEAVMKRPQENQKKDSFAESLASILFRVCLKVVSFTVNKVFNLYNVAELDALGILIDIIHSLYAIFNVCTSC